MNLEIQHLTFGWRDTPLFECVDVSLRGGTLVLLKGENGSGKTTLLKLLAGMIPHFSRGKCLQGDILFDGRSILKQPPKEFFPLIAFIPSKNIDFYLLNTTLAEELLLIEAVLPESAGAVRVRMDRFRSFFPQIDTLQSVPLSGLATVDKIRCLACIYYVQGARLWLLDEPFRHFPPAVSEAWKRFFSVLQACGSVIIASTHTGFDDGYPVWNLHRGGLRHD